MTNNIHNDVFCGSYLHLSSCQVISVAVKKARLFEESMDRVKLFR